MTERFRLAPDVVGAGTRLHRHAASLAICQVTKQGRSACELAALDNRTPLIKANQMHSVLTEINANRRQGHGIASCVGVPSSLQRVKGRREAAVHPIRNGASENVGAVLVEHSLASGQQGGNTHLCMQIINTIFLFKGSRITITIRC